MVVGCVLGRLYEKAGAASADPSTAATTVAAFSTRSERTGEWVDVFPTGVHVAKTFVDIAPELVFATPTCAHVANEEARVANTSVGGSPTPVIATPTWVHVANQGLDVANTPMRVAYEPVFATSTSSGVANTSGHVAYHSSGVA